MKHVAVIALGLLAAACAATPEPDPLGGLFGVSAAQSNRVAPTLNAHPFGSADNPVRADMPPGQRAYLARLRCADDRAPQFRRVGSFGVGPYGGVIDGYEVLCPGSSPASSIIYNRHVPPRSSREPGPGGVQDRPLTRWLSGAGRPGS